MADPQHITIADLITTLRHTAVNEEGVDHDTEILLASDEEGNSINFMFAFGVEKHPVTGWDSATDELEYAKDAKNYIVFYPSHEEADDE